MGNLTIVWLKGIINQLITGGGTLHVFSETMFVSFNFEHRQETFDFDDIIQANPVSVQSRNDQLQWCGPCVRCPRFRP